MLNRQFLAYELEGAHRARKEQMMRQRSGQEGIGKRKSILETRASESWEDIGSCRHRVEFRSNFRDQRVPQSGPEATVVQVLEGQVGPTG